MQRINRSHHWLPQLAQHQSDGRRLALARLPPCSYAIKKKDEIERVAKANR
jgi:ribosomal protein S7